SLQHLRTGIVRKLDAGEIGDPGIGTGGACCFSIMRGRPRPLPVGALVLKPERVPRRGFATSRHPSARAGPLWDKRAGGVLTPDFSSPPRTMWSGRLAAGGGGIRTFGPAVR